MVFFIIAGLALVMASAIFFVCRGQEDFYLDQKHVEKESSLRRFVRFGTIYVAVTKSK
jgi:hypothetical protein